MNKILTQKEECGASLQAGQPDPAFADGNIEQTNPRLPGCRFCLAPGCTTQFVALIGGRKYCFVHLKAPVPADAVVSSEQAGVTASRLDEYRAAEQAAVKLNAREILTRFHLEIERINTVHDTAVAEADDSHYCASQIAFKEAQRQLNKTKCWDY